MRFIWNRNADKLKELSDKLEVLQMAFENISQLNHQEDITPLVQAVMHLVENHIIVVEDALELASTTSSATVRRTNGEAVPKAGWIERANTELQPTKELLKALPPLPKCRDYKRS